MENKKITIEIGLFAKPLEEQLKEYNIPKNKTDNWEEICNFIIRQSLNRNITEKQEQKLFNGLFNEIVNYVNKLKKKCEYNKDDICVNADSKYLADYCPKDDINNIVRGIYRKGKELDENFDMTGLGEYIIANFLSEENEDEQN